MIKPNADYEYKISYIGGWYKCYKKKRDRGKWYIITPIVFEKETGTKIIRHFGDDFECYIQRNCDRLEKFTEK